MSDEWAVQPVQVWLLYRNGAVIRGEHGQPKTFASPDEAMHVAANWDDYRAPTIAERDAMSDDEVRQKATDRKENP